MQVSICYSMQAFYMDNMQVNICYNMQVFYIDNMQVLLSISRMLYFVWLAIVSRKAFFSTSDKCRLYVAHYDYFKVQNSNHYTLWNVLTAKVQIRMKCKYLEDYK